MTFRSAPPAWRVHDLRSGQVAEIEHDPVLPSHMISGSRGHRWTHLASPKQEEAQGELEAEQVIQAVQVERPVPPAVQLAPEHAPPSQNLPVTWEQAAPLADHREYLLTNMGVLWRNACTTLALTGGYLFLAAVIWAVYGLVVLIDVTVREVTFGHLVALALALLFTLRFGFWLIGRAFSIRWVAEFEPFA